MGPFPLCALSASPSLSPEESCRPDGGRRITADGRRRKVEGRRQRREEEEETFGQAAGKESRRSREEIKERWR